MIRNRKRTRGIALATVLIALAIPLAVFAQETVTYTEDFQDGEAQEWALDPGWRVEDGFLVGEGPGRALYERRDWDQMRFEFRVNQMVRPLRAIFRYGSGEHYAVDLAVDGDGLYPSLYRLRDDEQPDRALTTGKYQMPYQGYIEEEGLDVRIQYEGSFITVYADDTLVLRYADPEPLPPGFLGFDVLERGQTAIDWVEITGDQPPVQAEPEGPDLAIRAARVIDFEPDAEIVAVIEAELTNEGNVPSPPFDMLVGVTINASVSEIVPIEGLEPGESRVETLRLDLPAGWGNSTQDFLLEVDPDGGIAELNEDNNMFLIENVDIPTLARADATPVPTSRPPSSQPRAGSNGILFAGLAVLGVIALVAGAAGVFLLRRRALRRQRKQWEKQAKEDSPPNDCQSGQHYVEVETELDFQRFKVSEVSLAVFDPSGARRSETSLDDRFAADLDRAIRARLFGAMMPGASADRIAERVLEISTLLGEALGALVRAERASCDIALTAHLEGIEVSQTYTLYRCKGPAAATGWERVASWEVSRQATRDDVFAVAAGLNPLDGTRLNRLNEELQPHVRRYVERW